MSYKEFTADDIKPEDIVITTYIKPGIGSWNPTAERAVRVYYKPLGLTVTSADERSQWQNKQKCLEQIAELVNKAWNDPEFAERLSAGFQKTSSVEVLGTTCIDGGKCHHKCVDRCFRREGCVPFADYKGPWAYSQKTRTPPATDAGQVVCLPISPEFVWVRLLEALADDNGSSFSASTDDYREAKPALMKLIAAGFFKDDSGALDSDIWLAAAGEQGEASNRFGHAEPYNLLSDILNRIFNQGEATEAKHGH